MSKKYRPKNKKKIRIRPTDKRYQELKAKELAMLLDQIEFLIKKPLFRA